MKITPTNTNTYKSKNPQAFGATFVAESTGEIRKFLNTLKLDIHLKKKFLDELNNAEYIEDIKKIKLLDGTEPSIIIKSKGDKLIIKAQSPNFDNIEQIKGIEFKYVNKTNNSFEFKSAIEKACLQLENSFRFASDIIDKNVTQFVNKVC